MQEFCLLSVLRNLHGFASWLVDTRLPLRQVSFPFPAPAHQAVYGRLFDAPVRFGAAAASLELDAHWLQLPLVRDEAALNTMLQRALPLQVRPYKPAQPLVQRVRQALAAHPQCSHTAATLCAELHLAPRSLHRQLQAHGTSLQALKDAVRRDRALHLLQRTDTPLKRVAQACGFAGEKSFIRAFHQWTGQAPGAYRQAQRGR
jgi:AraC-like DNA-binding protein